MAIEEKPSRNEDEYFLKLDAELMKQRRSELDAQRVKEQRAQNLMRCPRDGHDLAERELHQVKVDICPACGGMWLDAGEMDLIREAGGRGGISRFVDDLFGIKR